MNDLVIFLFSSSLSSPDKLTRNLGQNHRLKKQAVPSSCILNQVLLEAMSAEFFVKRLDTKFSWNDLTWYLNVLQPTGLGVARFLFEGLAVKSLIEVGLKRETSFGNCFYFGRLKME